MSCPCIDLRVPFLPLLYLSCLGDQKAGEEPPEGAHWPPLVLGGAIPGGVGNQLRAGECSEVLAFHTLIIDN